uniref:Uncharacterized protein n=1 Tax=Arundo donax TaxID=35708 RepID=A0A0A9H3N3_ARUDO
MKSHEWVVWSFLFLFGNTEMTPGILASLMACSLFSFAANPWKPLL